MEIPLPPASPAIFPALVHSATFPKIPLINFFPMLSARIANTSSSILLIILLPKEVTDKILFNVSINFSKRLIAATIIWLLANPIKNVFHAFFNLAAAD